MNVQPVENYSLLCLLLFRKSNIFFPCALFFNILVCSYGLVTARNLWLVTGWELFHFDVLPPSQRQYPSARKAAFLLRCSGLQRRVLGSFVLLRRTCSPLGGK